MTGVLVTCCFSAYKVKSIFEVFMLGTQTGWWVHYKPRQQRTDTLDSARL